MSNGIKVDTKTQADKEQIAANKIWQQNNKMGKDQFLNLLMVQFKNQDPLKPMDNTQFISQMAQFTALEQMQQLNGSFSQLKAASMISRYGSGSYVDEKTGEKAEVQGIITSMKVKDGKTYVTIDGKDIEADSLDYVTDTKAEYQLETKMTTAKGMIGQKINVGSGTNKIEGTVKAVSEDDGIIKLTITTVDKQEKQVAWDYLVGLKMIGKKVTADTANNDVVGIATDLINFQGVFKVRIKFKDSTGTDVYSDVSTDHIIKVEDK